MNSTLEIGKTYRQRDGKISEEVKLYTGAILKSSYDFIVGGLVYTRNGFRYHGGITSPEDLVEECEG